MQPFLTTVRRIWQWLVTPPPHGFTPPYPDDKNTRGIGWAGDREEFRYRPFNEEKRNGTIPSTGRTSTDGSRNSSGTSWRDWLN